MNEKEKMLKGELYQPWDESLTKQRRITKEKTYDYNLLRPSSQRKERAEMIKTIFGSTGGEICVESPFLCDYGTNIHVGNNFYANHNCVILDGNIVEIGDNVLLAPNVGIYTAGHPYDEKLRNQGLEYALPVKIGNSVWIGAGVHIMPGVTIGNNVIIGAGSIVTKDIPDNVVAVGNPCKVIRPINDADRHKF